MAYLFLLCFSLGCSFNIDLENVVNISGDEGTYFGYSTVIFNNTEGNWIVAGAPKASFPDRTDINVTGNVYKCKVNFTEKKQNHGCVPFALRTQDLQEGSGYEDHQLLGASMALLKHSVMVCAPLWKINDSYPAGQCHDLERTLQTTRSYTAGNINQLKQLQKDDPEGFVGMGFAITRNQLNRDILGEDTSALVGAPGLINGRGGFLQYSTDGTSYKIYTANDIESDLKTSIHNGTYMGYSIAIGNLAVEHSCSPAVVLGAPHFKSSEGIIGAVLVVCLNPQNKTMIIKKQVFGKKNGSGFGSTVVFDDVNGDGVDDLIVGAPFQYKTFIDTGAVYVYYGVTKHDILVESQQVLAGDEVHSARFGTSIACIGDLNLDNYKDIVVGAPYQNDKRGSVFIYLGGPKRLTFTQKIDAIDVGTNLVSFGWYISIGFDIDQNKYPDFAVGSYMSDTVSIFRSRPIIDLFCTVTINPSLIPLNSSGLDCQTSGNYLPCATIKVCFNYTGVGIPDNILIAYSINADTIRTQSVPRKSSRVSIFVNNINHHSKFDESRLLVTKGQGLCHALTVRVSDVSRQFLSALKDELRFETSFSISDQSQGGKLKPVLNNRPKLQTTLAKFASGCTGICRPDLYVLGVSEPKQISFGGTLIVDIQVQILNIGDLAHGTRASVNFQSNTNYLGFNQPQNENTEIGRCKLEENNLTVVVCDLDKPLYQQRRGLFNVQFNVSRQMLVTTDQSVYNIHRNLVFNIKVESTDEDKDLKNNIDQLEIPVKFVSTIELLGKPEPEQHIQGNSHFLDMIHTYDLYNTGPSPVEEMVVKVCIPTTSNNVRISKQFDSPDTKLVWQQSSDTVLMAHTRTTRVPNVTSPQKSMPVKQTIAEISCDSTEVDTYTVYDVTIRDLEVKERASFRIHITYSVADLQFDKVSVMLFKTKGQIQTKDTEHLTIAAVNKTYYVKTEIFPHTLAAEAEKIDLGIIVGGCVGGAALLLVVGVLLWKVGFFKRRKQDEMSKWKRQSGYYATRKSQMLDHIPRQSRISNYDHW